MNDTPQHILDIQLKNWLSKTREERLLQFLKSNEAMFLGLRQVKKELQFPDMVTNHPPPNAP